MLGVGTSCRPPGLHPAAPCTHPPTRPPTLPQVKAFDEEASSLALHPGGYLLAAGFADRLRLMSVLAGEGRLAGWRAGGGGLASAGCLERGTHVPAFST